jgi:hypothetical protein
MDFNSNIWYRIDQLLNDLPAHREYKPELETKRKSTISFPPRKSSLHGDSFMQLQTTISEYEDL